PDLVAGVAGRRRTAARLADVADIDLRLAGRLHCVGQPLDVLQHHRLAPVAVAADADRLVARSVERQRLSALQAACGVEADRLRRTGRGRGNGRPVRRCGGRGGQPNREEGSCPKVTVKITGKTRGVGSPDRGSYPAVTLKIMEK